MRSKGIVGGAISVCIALFMAGILLPTALTSIYGANTTGWDTSVITVFRILLPVLGIIGLAVTLFSD